jgi:predicted nucleic acid-binding Zn ribbon protein
MSDDPLSVCPDCDEKSLRRVINSVGIVFKGSGFYVTDNRHRKNGSANGSSSPNSTTETEKSTETKSETKSEKKSKKSEKSDEST